MGNLRESLSYMQELLQAAVEGTMHGASQPKYSYRLRCEAIVLLSGLCYALIGETRNSGGLGNNLIVLGIEVAVSANPIKASTTVDSTPFEISYLVANIGEE